MTKLTVQDDDDMSPNEEEEYEIRSKRAIESLEQAAEDLIAIRTKKLYRKEFKTWELFCVGKLGITGRWALQLEKGAVAVEDVTKQIGTTVPKNAESKKTLAAVQGMSVSARAELHKIEAGKPRLDAVKAAITSGHPPTADAIKEAAKPKPAAPDEPEVVLDGTGYPIPEKRLALWNRGEEAKVLLKKVSEVRCTIRRAMDAGSEGHGDILFARTNLSSIMVDLDSAYRGLTSAVPWAVCSDCQGHRSETCTTCCGMGLVSEHFWKTALCEEARQLRVLSVKSMKK